VYLRARFPYHGGGGAGKAPWRDFRCSGFSAALMLTMLCWKLMIMVNGPVSNETAMPSESPYTRDELQVVKMHIGGWFVWW